MAKWVLLFFVVALVCSGWWASRADAAGWAPALPTLVLAAGVITGMAYAIRYGLRRRKEMAKVAAHAGMDFTNQVSREFFRELGLGALKLYVYCRPVAELSFLQRSVRASFHNVMSSQHAGAELYVFDYVTSTGSGGPDQRGTFVCFRTPGAKLPDLEIVPRLWGERPEWLKGVTDAPPARAEVRVDNPGFHAEYRADAADAAAARNVLDSYLLQFFGNGNETGWRMEMSGDWVAVTRLAPAKNIGGLTEPMAPEKLPPELRRSYFEHPIGPEHLPRFIDVARRLYERLPCSSP